MEVASSSNSQVRITKSASKPISLLTLNAKKRRLQSTFNYRENSDGQSLGKLCDYVTYLLQFLRKMIGSILGEPNEPTNFSDSVTNFSVAL